MMAINLLLVGLSGLRIANRYLNREVAILGDLVINYLSADNFSLRVRQYICIINIVPSFRCGIVPILIKRGS